MAQQLRISTAIYLIVGIGAYFAWSPAVVITSGLWPDADSFLLDLNWTCNLLGHTVTLALLSLFMRKIAPFTGKRAGLLTPALSVALSTLLLAIAFLDARFAMLVAPASLLAGAGMACLLLIWSESLILVRDIGAQHLVIEASVISALLMTVVIICLPPLFGAVVCAVLPFAMSLCSHRAARQLVASSNQAVATNEPEKVTQINNAPRSQSAVFSLSALLICCFVLALPAGMYQGAAVPSQGADEANLWRTLLAINCVLVTVAAVVDHSLSRRKISRLFSRLIVPLMAGGLLIISVVGSGLEEWGGCVMQIGYQLFLIYIYTEFAHMADDRSTMPGRIFTMGTCAIDFGLFAGYLVITGTTLFRSNWVQGAILAIVYLLILVGILVFPRVIDQSSARAKKGIPSFFFGEPERKGGHELSSSKTIADFASTYGLSSREEEIMQHLVRGRTLPSIAEETCLSYNTVKTHVSHIYQKVGVHTRDELLDTLEKSDPSHSK